MISRHAARPGTRRLIAEGRSADPRERGRMVRRATRADESWRTMIDEVRGTLGIARGVEVRRSSEIDVPAVAGIVSPVLPLPIADEWTATERRDVALHELAHVARWDALSQAIGAVACAAYWFVPLTWYAARQAALLREQAYDNVVLRAGTRPATYAERLIALARAPLCRGDVDQPCPRTMRALSPRSPSQNNAGADDQRDRFGINPSIDRRGRVSMPAPARSLAKAH